MLYNRTLTRERRGLHNVVLDGARCAVEDARARAATGYSPRLGANPTEPTQDGNDLVAEELKRESC